MPLMFRRISNLVLKLFLGQMLLLTFVSLLKYAFIINEVDDEYLKYSFYPHVLLSF